MAGHSIDMIGGRGQLHTVAEDGRTIGRPGAAIRRITVGRGVGRGVSPASTIEERESLSQAMSEGLTIVGRSGDE